MPTGNDNTSLVVTSPRAPNRKPRTRKDNPKNRKIDPHKALALKVKGNSYQDIANMFNCSKALVIRTLKPYAGIFDGTVEDFKNHRADLLAAGQRELLASIGPAEIKKMSIKDRAVAFGIFYDKERLERGQSTSNHSIMARAVEAACNLD